MSTETNDRPPTDLDEEFDRTIDNCLDTYRLCQRTRGFLVRTNERYVTEDRLRLLDDCAEANFVLANFLLRRSIFRYGAARLCSDIASACADAFEQLERKESEIRVLYAACRRSVADCERLLRSGIEEEAPEGDDLVEEASEESFPASDPLPPPGV